MSDKYQSKEYFHDSFSLPSSGLRSYFEHVREGQPDEYRTTFYRGQSVSSVLDEWTPKLKQIEDLWPTLFEFENDLAKKVGPMSIMKPLKDRLVDIESYYDGILLPSMPLSERSMYLVLDEWSKLSGLQLRSEMSTVDLMKKSTNSGSPYFTKRKAVTNKTIPCTVYTVGDKVRQVLKNSSWSGCAVLGWRGQEGGPTSDDVKQRVVWMFPYSVNIQELRLYQVLIEKCQQNDYVPAWISMEAVDQKITDLFDTKGADDLIVCTDFSKFDQHFNHQLQECAKNLIKHMFTGVDDWLKYTYPIKYMIPLAYDWETVRFGPHGMASGSGGTNADETLAHRCLQHQAALNAGAVLNPNSQCLGDDGILSYSNISVEDVVQTYSCHGLEMNLDKQYASKQDCTYLRRWHHTDYRINDVCVGVYATTRALGRLCEQERYYDPEIWSKEMVALRQLSIIENVKYHPLRDQFADFCIRGDKYKLGIDIPGFLDNITDIAKKAIDLMPDFLGYTKSLQKVEDPSQGISDWWIVNYLKSK